MVLPTRLFAKAYEVATPSVPGGTERVLQSEYGWGITCHKAQGSQARRVIVFGSWCGGQGVERLWLYTAASRRIAPPIGPVRRALAERLVGWLGGLSTASSACSRRPGSTSKSKRRTTRTRHQISR